MKRSLKHIIDWASMNPGYVQDYCRYWFDHIQVGYVPSLDQIQIACFDSEGECRLCIRYQFYGGIWKYEVVPGFMYREPVEESV